MHKSIIIKFKIPAIRKILKRDGSEQLRRDALNLMNCAISTLLDIKCKTKKRVLEISDKDLFL
jgi:hypothetical protein